MGSAARYRRLDENSVQGHIGKSGFGAVFVAVDTAADITVAVKRLVLPSHQAMIELCFYKALSQGPHPNLMNLLDHFYAQSVAGKCLYMVFEFMDTTLWHMWKHRRRILPQALCVSFVSDMVGGITHLHLMEIIHTDLSMSNLLVSSSTPASSQVKQGHVLRIADLGGAVSAVGLVLPSNRVLSTESVRAPEALLGDTQPTVAVDLWSLGVVTMALTCGSLFFFGIRASR